MDRDLTQEALAKLTTCSLSTIRKIEADQRRPSRELAVQFAERFQLDAEATRQFIGWVRTKEAERATAPKSAARPAAAARGRGPTNLPTPATSFIGRAPVVAAIQDHLRSPRVRLLTLVGSPGIGKTRLALQAAAGLRGDFPDGVRFVALAPLRDARLVAPLVARTLGVKETAHRSVQESLLKYLESREALLVLDNFEQVLDAAPLITEWLAAAPQLKVLVTSRAALDVYGEQTFAVPFLDLPDPQVHLRVDQLLQYESVLLFLERARAVKPDFTLTAENAPLVAAVCARLEGLPLTIELAAARTRLFPLPGLLARLQNRLTLLMGTARDLPARQQTLRGALDWSYDLLDPDEQRLFCRLGVFVGSCTIEAAEAVCQGENGPGWPVFAGIESLVAKSLLQQEDQGDDEPRFHMLGTIREYALDRLPGHGPVEVTHRRHALYYLALAERAGRALTGKQQASWLARLDKEHDNLRAALTWAIGAGAAELALRLGGELGRFWEVHGPVSEGRRWLAAALALDRSAPAPVRAKALHAAGNLAFDEDDYSGATALHEESLALRRALNDEAGIAATLNSLGNIALRQGAYTQAQGYYEESLALHRALGDWAGVGLTLINRGAVAVEQLAYAQAQECFEEALRRMRALGDTWGSALALNHLGEVALYQDDYARAAVLLEESLRLFRTLGDKRRSARALGSLGLLARKQTDYARGQPFYQESLALFQQVGANHGIAVCLEGLAAVAGGQGQLVRAGRLRGAAEAIRARIGAPPPYDGRAGRERRVSPARVAGDADLVARARHEGRAMPLDQAVAYALEGTDLAAPERDTFATLEQAYTTDLL